MFLFLFFFFIYPTKMNDSAGNILPSSNEPAFNAVEPHRRESRLEMQAGMQLSESELSDRPLEEDYDRLSESEHSEGREEYHEPAAPAEKEEKKQEVVAPYGWPTCQKFPRWYWRRLTGFDQSLDVYGFYPSWDQLIAFVFVCATMVVLAVIDHYGFYHLAGHSVASFLPALGASCTVVYAVPKAPISQPRCVIFSHVTAAIIGTALTNAFRSVNNPPQPFGEHCAGALGVALHLALMIITNTLHPPASATVISAATQTINAYYQDEGFLFVVTPSLLGPLIVVAMAMILNNLVPARAPYPQFW